MTSTLDTSGEGPEYVVEVSVESSRRAAEVQERYEQWAGVFLDHQAAEVIVAYANNADQEECVARYGSQWTAGWESAIAPASASYFFDGSPLASPPVRTATDWAQRNRAALALEPVRRQEPPPGEAEALDACSGEIDSAGPILGKLSEEDLTDLLRPPVLEQLHDEWQQTLDGATEPFGSAEDTYSCLSRTDLGSEFQDVPAGDFGENWQRVVSDAIPAPDAIPGADDPATPAWTRARATEAAYVQALWQCHAPSFDDVILEVSHAADDFESRHSEQIRAANAHWREVRQIAVEMGWSPERPLAGYR